LKQEEAVSSTSKELTKETALALAEQTMRQEIAAISELIDGLGDAFWECAQLLSGCPGLIWVTGVGTSAAVGSRFAHILTDCGARSMFLTPADGLHGHSAVMTPNDLLVAMSRGGGSSEVNQMAEIANRRGVTTIALSAVVLEAKGYTLEQLGQAHPGGAVVNALASSETA
jgi:arabinose-5-phosphate isomerase